MFSNIRILVEKVFVGFRHPIRTRSAYVGARRMGVNVWEAFVYATWLGNGRDFPRMESVRVGNEIWTPVSVFRYRVYRLIPVRKVFDWAYRFDYNMID